VEWVDPKREKTKKSPNKLSSLQMPTFGALGEAGF
jgi:hypothetical protein